MICIRLVFGKKGAATGGTKELLPLFVAKNGLNIPEQPLDSLKNGKIEDKPDRRKEADMSYSNDDLAEKLREMYPEIDRFGLSLGLEFDEDKDAWVVSFAKGAHKRHAFLDKKDADACIEGNACIYLGMLVAQYIKDLEMAIS
jgi:hypothetical protein